MSGWGEEQMMTRCRVKAARALLDWNQGELANAASIGISTVADFECGKRWPRARTMKAMHEAFEKNGIQFITGGVRRISWPAPLDGGSG